MSAPEHRTSGTSRSNTMLDRVDKFSCDHCGKRYSSEQAVPLSRITCPACGETILIPGRLGGFKVLSLLGRGAMGEVYRGYDTKLERPVAIKVLQGRFATDQRLKDWFLAEARAIATLNDPHIVQIYSLGEHREYPFIVMELVEGVQLDDGLKKEGKKFEETRLLRAATDITQGLQAAWEAGMVHGDIKPANILFDRKGRAKILDFGLAKAAHTQDHEKEIWGTPFYISPERIKKETEDHRSDMYSLGTSLFHVLAGQPPFDAPSAKDTVLQRLRVPAPDIRTLRPEISESSARILSRMLKHMPNERYPTHASLLGDLGKALSERTQPPTARNPRSRSSMPVFLFLGLAALAGAGVFLIQRMAEDAQPSPVPVDPAPLEAVVEAQVQQRLQEQEVAEFRKELQQLQAEKNQHWLNTRSGVRHNNTCIYFKNTSQGRITTGEEGRPCPRCGG